MPIYCYSTDEERFHGDFGSRDDAIAEATQDDDPGSVVTVWSGEQKLAIDYLRGTIEAGLCDHVEGYLDEWLADCIGWEDQIVKVPDDKRAGLGRLILDYLDEHSAFQAFGIVAVQEHEVAIPSTGG